MVPRLVRMTCVAVAVFVGTSACGEDGTGPELTEALVDLAAGVQHTCGLTASGDAYCWGWNRDGQLGDETTRDRSAPVAVHGGRSFTQLVAGGGHTCGLSGGMAYCWGFNLNGQLGDGSTVTRALPTAVAGSIDFASIRAGGSYTCGVAMDGTGYCWGWNQYAQLGIGSTDDQSTPVALPGGLSFASITPGNTHTCGLTTDGQIYCWGRNQDGQLGDGTADDRETPALVSGTGPYVQIAVGDEHTCALTSGGTVQCWGRNQFSQIGIPGVALVPTDVTGSHVFGSVFAKALYSCALQDASGQGFCWGANSVGQQAMVSAALCSVLDELGEVTQQVPCTTEPTAMDTDIRYSQLVLGSHHACGISVGNPVAYCWGGGPIGELGNGRTGTTYFDPVPQKVIGQP